MLTATKPSLHPTPSQTHATTNPPVPHAAHALVRRRPALAAQVGAAQVGAGTSGGRLRQRQLSFGIQSRLHGWLPPLMQQVCQLGSSRQAAGDLGQLCQQGGIAGTIIKLHPSTDARCLLHLLQQKSLLWCCCI